MNPEGATPKLWVIDRQDHRRNVTVEILQTAGFKVCSYRGYDELLQESGDPVPTPNLILLSCAAYQKEEQELLATLSQRGYPVLILASFLSHSEARDLFLLGAADVALRPRTSDSLLSIIDMDLLRIAQRRERSCYL